VGLHQTGGEADRGGRRSGKLVLLLGGAGREPPFQVPRSQPVRNVGLGCARQVFSLSQQVLQIAIQPLVKDGCRQLPIAFEEVCLEQTNNGRSVSGRQQPPQRLLAQTAASRDRVVGFAMPQELTWYKMITAWRV
jgi:hypothetical protein